MPRPIARSKLDQAALPEERIAHDLRYHALRAEDEHAQWRNGNKPGVGLGFATLDNDIRLIPGQFIIVNGPSSSGKTSLAVQVAMHVAEASGPASRVLFFSAEMTGAELTHKMASLRSGISVTMVRNNYATEQQHDSYAAELAIAKTLPIAVNDMVSPTTDNMFEIVQEYNNAGVHVPLVVFDYLGIAGDEVERAQEHQRIATIAARLKSLAKMARVPVLAVGQTNRTINETRHKLPTPQTTAGSEAVNRFADVSLGLCWPEYWFRDGESVLCEYVSDTRNTIYINAVKSRWGERAKIWRLAFQASITKFYDLPASDVRGLTVRNRIVRMPTDREIVEQLAIRT